MQGYGYNVVSLMEEIAEILGMNKHYTAVIVGAGRLANVLVASFPFERYGITVRGLYDIDTNLVGTTMSEKPIYHVDDLSVHLTEYPVDIGILTAPSSAANELANTLSDAGVKGIWNFTNVELHPRNGNPIIEDVHMFDSVFSLCCMVNGY